VNFGDTATKDLGAQARAFPGMRQIQEHRWQVRWVIRGAIMSCRCSSFAVGSGGSSIHGKGRLEANYLLFSSYSSSFSLHLLLPSSPFPLFFLPLPSSPFLSLSPLLSSSPLLPPTCKLSTQGGWSPPSPLVDLPLAVGRGAPWAEGVTM
jgi:hypothetical protein